MKSALTVDAVASNMKRHGAPIFGDEAGGDLTLEETLALGVRAARKDSTLCRIWPVLYARNADRVDVEKVVSLATELGEKRACGYLLCVTAKLVGDDSLVAQAEALREEVSEPTYFSSDPERRDGLCRLDQRKTDELTLRWGFWYGNPFDLFFLPCFEKHQRRYTKGQERGTNLD